MLVSDSVRFNDFFLLPTDCEVAGGDVGGRTSAALEEVDMVGV